MISLTKIQHIIHGFWVPLVVLAGLIIYLIFIALGLSSLAIITALLIIALGTYDLFKEALINILHKKFGLDYIAILAVVVSIITGQFLVGIVIALMSSGGIKLEEYGASQAKRSLTELADRIPHDVLVEDNGSTQSKPGRTVQEGEIIVVRKGEVIPLDGKLLSNSAVIDESSLTGEVYPNDKLKGDLIRSGTINLDGPVRVDVANTEQNSSYTKIVTLVQQAQQEKAPLIRLADQYSIYFTLITLVIAGFAFALEHNLDSILAVLVVATPCPLILATPIALIGGMNKSARNRTIVKKLASIESLSRVNSIVFDKTGTITLGKPVVTSFSVVSGNKEDNVRLLAISQAIERNSLHPLAKAIVSYAHTQKTQAISVTQIQELIGKGISGIVDGTTYSLSKIPNANDADMAIGLFKQTQHIATFHFEDEIKSNTLSVLKKLQYMGIDLALFTGDKKEVAERLMGKLGMNFYLKAECKPEDKQQGIEELKRQGKVTAMVGDGINDAPALALADVGMVFSNEEQTAASEAADIVFLNGTFATVLDTVLIAKRTIQIARQSILWGIGLSIVFMIMAAFGYIPPIVGAGIQEVIDVVTILNALRASR